MATIDQCDGSRRNSPALSSTLKIFDTFKSISENGKDSDSEESFHLPLFDEDDKNQSLASDGGGKESHSDEAEEKIFNKFDDVSDQSPEKNDNTLVVETEKPADKQTPKKSQGKSGTDDDEDASNIELTFDLEYDANRNGEYRNFYETEDTVPYINTLDKSNQSETDDVADDLLVIDKSLECAEITLENKTEYDKENNTLSIICEEVYPCLKAEPIEEDADVYEVDNSDNYQFSFDDMDEDGDARMTESDSNSVMELKNQDNSIAEDSESKPSEMQLRGKRQDVEDDAMEQDKETSEEEERSRSRSGVGVSSSKESTSGKKLEIDYNAIRFNETGSVSATIKDIGTFSKPPSLILLSGVPRQAETSSDITKVGKRSLPFSDIRIEVNAKKAKLIVDAPNTDTQNEIPHSPDIPSSKIKSKEQVPIPNDKIQTLTTFAKFMQSQKLSSKLSRSNLEQFCIQKICECLMFKSTEGELHQTIKKQQKVIDGMRKDLQQLMKQSKDLEIVNRKLINDMRFHYISKKKLAPLKITRSVGLQVHLKPGSNESLNQMRKSQPMSTTPQNPVVSSPRLNSSKTPLGQPAAVTQVLQTSPQKTMHPPSKVPSSSSTQLQYRAFQQNVRRKSYTPINRKSATTPRKPEIPPASNSVVIDLTDEDEEPPVNTSINNEVKLEVKVNEIEAAANNKTVGLQQQKINKNNLHLDLTDEDEKPAANTSINNAVKLANDTGVAAYNKAVIFKKVIPGESVFQQYRAFQQNVSTKSCTPINRKSATTPRRPEIPPASHPVVIDLTEENEEPPANTSINNEVKLEVKVNETEAAANNKTVGLQQQKINKNNLHLDFTDEGGKPASNTSINNAVKLVNETEVAAYNKTVIFKKVIPLESVYNQGKPVGLQQEKINKNNLPQGIKLAPESDKSSSDNDSKIVYLVSPIASSSAGTQKVSFKFEPTKRVLSETLHRSTVPVMSKKGQTLTLKPIASLLRKKHPAPLPPLCRITLEPNLKPILPKPHVIIKKIDPFIILTWQMPYNLDMYEKIASYQLYIYKETSAPPSTNMWKKLGDIKALALPIACTLSRFVNKGIYYFAIRSVDVHNRKGMFSDPQGIFL